MTERTRAEYWGPYAAGMALAIAFVVFALAGIYSFRQQDHINKQLCQQTVDNREATRHTWDAARGIVLRGQPSLEQRIATNEFFDAILREVPRLTCRDNKPVEVLG